MNNYGIWGPPLKDYREAVKNLHPNVAIAHLKSFKDLVQVESLDEIKSIYVREELFRPAGSVYQFGTVDENDDLEAEIYPTADWLTIMQSPRMSPAAVQESEIEFHRLTSSHENTDNYVIMSALWRGLEHRIISQVMTPRDFPELKAGQVIMRPTYLHIDPFMLMRLKPVADSGIESADEAMKHQKQKPGKPLPDNIAELFKPRGQK